MFSFTTKSLENPEKKGIIEKRSSFGYIYFLGSSIHVSNKKNTSLGISARRAVRLKEIMALMNIRHS